MSGNPKIPPYFSSIQILAAESSSPTTMVGAAKRVRSRSALMAGGVELLVAGAARRVRGGAWSARWADGPLLLCWQLEKTSFGCLTLLLSVTQILE